MSMIARALQQAAGNSGSTLVKTITNPNSYTSAGDAFGSGITVFGNRLLASALNEEGPSGQSNVGVAYLFDTADFSLLHTFYSSTYQATGYFGIDTAMNSSHIAISSLENLFISPATYTLAGKVRVYDASTYSLVATLDDPNAQDTPTGDYFFSLAMSEDYLVVGAYREKGSSGELNSGYVYVYDTATWTLQQSIINPNDYNTQTEDRFGAVVAVNATYMAASAAYEDSASAGATGVVYVYDVATWSLIWTVDNPNAYGTASNDLFGTSIAIQGNYLIVSAPDEDTATTGGSGVVYVFDIPSKTLLYTLQNPNFYAATANTRFGANVVANSHSLFVGTHQADNGSATDSGLLYRFVLATGQLISVTENPNVYGTATSDQFSIYMDCNEEFVAAGAIYEDDAAGSDNGVVYVFAV